MATKPLFQRHKLREWLDADDLVNPPDVVTTPQYTLDFNTFAPTHLRIDNQPFTFTGREWLHDIVKSALRPDATTVILKSRQVGASTLFAALMIWLAVKYPGFAQMYVCDTQDHMHDFSVDKLLPMIESSGDSVALHPDKQSRIRRYYFANGSRIMIMSAHGQFKQTRGPHIDALYVDEAQSVEIDHMPVAESALMTSKYRFTIVAGTGGDDGDPWSRMWAQTTQHEWENRKSWQAGAPDALITGYHIRPQMNPHYTQAMDDKFRKIWTPYRYQTEWLAEHATGHALPFPHSLIIKSYYEGDPVLPHNVDRELGPVYLSMDLAIGGNAYTVPVIAQHQTQADRVQILQAFALGQSRTDDLYSHILGLIQDYNPDEIIMDAGGNPGLTERMTDNHDVYRYYMSGTQKEAIKYADHDEFAERIDTDTIAKADFIEKVKQRFEAQLYHIPFNQDMEWTIKHLLAERAEVITPKGGIGRPRYSNKAGEPDDFLMALTFLEAHIYSKSDENNPHNVEYFVSGPVK